MRNKRRRPPARADAGTMRGVADGARWRRAADAATGALAWLLYGMLAALLALA